MHIFYFLIFLLHLSTDVSICLAVGLLLCQLLRSYWQFATDWHREEKETLHPSSSTESPIWRHPRYCFWSGNLGLSVITTYQKSKLIRNKNKLPIEARSLPNKGRAIQNYRQKNITITHTNAQADIQTDKKIQNTIFQYMKTTFKAKPTEVKHVF